MTAPTDQVSEATPVEQPSGADARPDSGPDQDEVPRRPRHLRPVSRWWRYGFPATLVVLTLAIPVLVWVGSRVVLNSSDGRVVSSERDPAAPGWQATVDPTPVMVVAMTDAQGRLDSLSLLALTAEGTGAIVQIPASTVMGVPGIGNIPLDVVQANSGMDAVKNGVQGILGIGLDEFETIGPAEWADLVRPVGPLKVTNPDPVSHVNSFGVAEVLFPSGDITLPADQVWTYLSTRSPGATELSRMVRIQAFWQAWLHAIAASPTPDRAVPGEVESGIGRYVRVLAPEAVDIRTLPTRGVAIAGQDDAAFEPDGEQVHDLVASVVPFPAGPEGTRARVAVLDGTGKLDHGLGAAVLLAAAGGQIDKVGNATTFEVATTQLVFYDEAARSRVERLREALGVGDVIKSDELNSAVDVTVVLGADYAATGRHANVPFPLDSTVSSGGG